MEPRPRLASPRPPRPARPGGARQTPPPEVPALHDPERFLRATCAAFAASLAALPEPGPSEYTALRRAIQAGQAKRVGDGRPPTAAEALAEALIGPPRETREAAAAAFRAHYAPAAAGAAPARGEARAAEQRFWALTRLCESGEPGVRPWVGAAPQDPEASEVHPAFIQAAAQAPLRRRAPAAPAGAGRQTEGESDCEFHLPALLALARRLAAGGGNPSRPPG